MTAIRCTICCTALLLLCANSGCSDDVVAANKSSNAGDAASLDRVKTALPARKTLTRTTVQPGRIEAFEATPLHAKVSGYVDDVNVDLGDRVTRGQVLIRLSAPEMQDDLRQAESSLAQAKAEVIQAESMVAVAEAKLQTAAAAIVHAEAGSAKADADLERWKSEYDRMQILASDNSVTKKLEQESLQQLRAAEAGQEEARATITVAQAGRVEAEANVRKAKADHAAAMANVQVMEAMRARQQSMVGYLELKAPYDGVVTARNIDTGHFLQAAAGAGKPLMAIARTDRVRVFVDVPESEAALVDSGQSGDAATVQVQALDGKSFTGKVTRTSWALDSTNRSLRVEIDLPNDQELLRPGMYAQVKIVLDERPDVAVLPTTAIIPGDEPACFVVRSGKLRKTVIKLGLRSGDEVEVLQGLGNGDNVVLTGIGGLKEGQSAQMLAP